MRDADERRDDQQEAAYEIASHGALGAGASCSLLRDLRSLSVVEPIPIIGRPDLEFDG